MFLNNFFSFSFLSNQKINLGLDLKGGSEILFKINYEEYFEDQFNYIKSELKKEFRKNKIKLVPKSKNITINDEKQSAIFLSKNENEKQIKNIVKKIDNDLFVEKYENGLLLLFNKESKNKIIYNLLQKSVQIIQKRIDSQGTKETLIQTQGKDKILVQVPGLVNPNELKKVLGKTGKLTFHFINFDSLNNEDNALLDYEKLKVANTDTYLNVNKEIVLDGNFLEDAYVSYYEGKPVVSFYFNKIGTKKFAEITKNNIGKILGIVLDNEIVTAPVINTPIFNGNAIITGDFSVEEANRISTLLKAGALPVSLNIIQENTVGPSLGLDSIHQGLFACLYGFLFVLLFMICLYKKFGIIADITLIMNLIITIACLSLLNATMTLPGIAGIVLSIGMAVDTNVLIFERIKEEYTKSNNVRQSIENGFDFAWTTIFDSNITTLFVAIILYAIGSGSIRGFALILSIGIFISFFTGVLLTKLFLYVWLNKFNLKTINL